MLHPLKKKEQTGDLYSYPYFPLSPRKPLWSGTNNGKLKTLLEASDWLEMKHMKKNISKLLKPFKNLSVYGEVHSYEDLLMKS